MDTRRLLFLHELARLGSMQRVADELHVTTSTVSQQIAQLSRDVKLRLVEPDGRRVRLTPAGRRLADHAGTILTSLDTARRDLGSDDPGGVVRVAGFATAIRRALLPAIRRLSDEHPRITLHMREFEPREAMAALADGAVDLALVYDYSLTPIRFDRSIEVNRLWSAPWGLGVPAAGADDLPAGLDAPTTVRRYAHERWIVNSRNSADEDLLRILASMADFEPEIAHAADSLDLVRDLITSGHGVGMLPMGAAMDPGIRVLPLDEPPALLRAFAVTRRGHTQWTPLAIVRDLLTEHAASRHRAIPASPAGPLA